MRHTLGNIIPGGRSGAPADDEDDDDEDDDDVPARSDDMDRFDWTTLLLSNDVGRIISSSSSTGLCDFKLIWIFEN